MDGTNTLWWIRCSRNNNKESIVMNADCMCKAVFQLFIHFPTAEWFGGARVDIWLESSCIARWFGLGWQETPPCFENFAWCALFPWIYGGLAWSDLWTSGVKGETIYCSEYRIGLVSLGDVSIRILVDQRVSQELRDSTLLSTTTLLTLRQGICQLGAITILPHFSEMWHLPLPWLGNS